MIVYRCPKCGSEYRPLDAGIRRYICCGVPLERAQAHARPPSMSSPREPSAVSVVSERSPWVAVEIVPPLDNTVDALAAETLYGALSGVSQPFGLEIVGDQRGVRFVLRALPDTLPFLQRCFQAAYGGVRFEEVLPEEDVIRRNGLHIRAAELALRRPAYLPLRTYRDGQFREADPINGLLGAFTVNEGFVMSQMVLFPAPPSWSDRYQASARRLGQTMGGEQSTPNDVVGQLVTGGIVLLVALPCSGIGLGYATQNWVLLSLSVITFFLLGGGGLAALALLRPRAVDPEMVRRKIEGAAFDVSLRVFAGGQTPEQADMYLRNVVSAYQSFNLASGNALVARRSQASPAHLELPGASWSFWQRLTDQITRLNVSELASLWHLPVANSPLVSRALSRHLPPPRPDRVATGILVGTSEYQGTLVPVHLDPGILHNHTFLVAKTQMGKSTLMAHLAKAAMNEKATALVVIDPHGDLVRTLLGVVPRERIADTYYLDFGDTQQVLGFNLLDMRQGRGEDMIVSNFIHIGEQIWTDYWGPRMEDALRIFLLTLLSANKAYVEGGFPQLQFTLLDIPLLIEVPELRGKIVSRYVTSFEVRQWWSGYFDVLDPKLRLEIVNPVLTKIHRFSTHRLVRAIVGQSQSTIRLQDLLERRRILLVNTATGIVGPDASGLLGAVLVDHINFAVREQMALDPAERRKVVVIIDEFQSIPGVDYPALLAELQKMGASFVLATQALGQLDAIARELRPSIMSNISTLFVFQSSAEDAQYLTPELDEQVTVTDIVNLPQHTCYVKTRVRLERLPVMRINTPPPPQPDPDIIARVLAQVSRYTRPLAVVEEERAAIVERHIGQELATQRNVQIALTPEQLEGVPRPRPGYEATSSQPVRLSPEGKDYLERKSRDPITGQRVSTADPPSVREAQGTGKKKKGDDWMG